MLVKETFKIARCSVRIPWIVRAIPIEDLYFFSVHSTGGDILSVCRVLAGGCRIRAERPMVW